MIPATLFVLFISYTAYNFPNLLNAAFTRAYLSSRQPRNAIEVFARKAVDQIKESTITIYNRRKQTLSIDIRVELCGAAIVRGGQSGWLSVKDLAPGQSIEVRLIDAFSDDSECLVYQIGRVDPQLKVKITASHYRINNGSDKEIKWHAPVKVIMFRPEGSVSFGPK